MRARLSQVVPVFRQKNLHIGLCPEDFFEATPGAGQCNVIGINARIDPAATPGAANVPGDKTLFRSALPQETQSISIS